eukprot:jgi/Chlat1/7822/Chrsp66S07274
MADDDDDDDLGLFKYEVNNELFEDDDDPPIPEELRLTPPLEVQQAKRKRGRPPKAERSPVSSKARRRGDDDDNKGDDDDTPYDSDRNPVSNGESNGPVGMRPTTRRLSSSSPGAVAAPAAYMDPEAAELLRRNQQAAELLRATLAEVPVCDAPARSGGGAGVAPAADLQPSAMDTTPVIMTIDGVHGRKKFKIRMGDHFAKATEAYEKMFGSGGKAAYTFRDQPLSAGQTPLQVGFTSQDVVHAVVDSGKKVIIKVCADNQTSRQFSIRTTDPLSKLFAAYNSSAAMQASRFSFDGALLKPSQTAEELGLEDEDIIDALL